MKKGKKVTPSVTAPTVEVAAVPAVDNTAPSAVPTGASLIRQYKAQGMSLKDAYVAAAKLNPGIKEASFKAGWYTKTEPTGKVKHQPKTPSKVKAAVAPNKAVVKAKPAAKSVQTARGPLSDTTKKYVVEVLKARVAELEGAIKELGG
jgi:hypothetical protein